MSKVHSGWMVIVLSLSMLGCSGDDDDDDSQEKSAPLEIIGEYDDNFGGEQIITTDAWNSATIEDYDNAKNVVYTHNPKDDMFNPSKFSKYQYTDVEDDSFYFCQVVFDADTLADARGSDATADSSNPGKTGCGGDFSWTRATKK